MKKAIVIEKCTQCPYKNHRGGFGKISYVPCCGMTGKDLPYTLSQERNMIIAVPTGEIPCFCPLVDFLEPEPFLQK